MESNDSTDDAVSVVDVISPLASELDKISTSESKMDYDCQRIILVSHYDNDTRPNNPPAPFEPVEFVLYDGLYVKIGRPIRGSENITSIAPTPPDMSNCPMEINHPNDELISTNAVIPVAVKKINHVWFKSKVVSRNHAEFWMKNGQVYVKDAGSSSGSFLNGMRMSPAGKQSRPYPLKDGDILQLGIDYQGRPEDIFKAVIIKIILQASQHPSMKKPENTINFRKALSYLLTASNPFSTGKSEHKESSTSDCCICLSGIGPFQALFLSPCSHCFHYKCIRNILMENGQMFPCPVCRQVANLEASVSMESLCETFEEGFPENEDIKKSFSLEQEKLKLQSEQVLTSGNSLFE